jgi:hypothetical protein
VSFFVRIYLKFCFRLFFAFPLAIQTKAYELCSTNGMRDEKWVIKKQYGHKKGGRGGRQSPENKNRVNL